ncbi:MAG: phosphoribosylformylglycinamidine cyclo-ligase [Verrucomicrobia bacterium]|nr:phosphoribosylformylglycinamidine cyclo-ligase [Verrucomicrobiota bacterium]MCF7707492.1 phosphoribosylformylglycinamidine cyclo-ligase [Verrucomicrobiota bacterium]
MPKKRKEYARAGVDIDLGNRLKLGLPTLLGRTKRKGVIGTVGGFGGLFALDTKKYRKPVLVSSVDGVGTKLKVAFAVNRHDTIGQDLVNHCVNDIIVIGAEPLFFLDYLGAGKLEEGVFTKIIEGFAKACAENHCALIGGETAQMPGFYSAGEYDVSGTIVGVVERSRILDGRRIKPGDILIGLGSSGLHTNGYSLARRVVFDVMKLKPGSRVAGLDCSIGDELLKVHRSYGPLTGGLLKRFNNNGSGIAIKGMAHITGGGFIDNLPRVMPKNCDAIIRKGSWEVPSIFDIIQREGRIVDAEMHQTFNMGIGMVLIVDTGQADALMRSIRARKHSAWVIGEIAKGAHEVHLK